MPRVGTIEGLSKAVRTFDATPLGLQVDPEADAVVRESLRRTGLVLLGEVHGVRQTPVLLDELIAWFGLGGIALEWNQDLRPWLDDWLTDGVLADSGWEYPQAEVWCGDGRLTAGHLALLRRWAAAGILITLMDGPVIMKPRPGESQQETSRRWWGERDAEMADRVLAAPDVPGGRLVVAGNMHTLVGPLPADDPRLSEVGTPMGVELARQRPGLRSIGCAYGPGRFYNNGPRRSRRDGLRGHGSDGPRLIVQDGALQLEVPSPREATVPHRDLPTEMIGIRV